jgi:methylthioribose-1-phosphate isomerase
MKVNGTPYRSIWFNEDRQTVEIIDQTRLPHCFVILSLHGQEDAAEAIRNMRVRGAPLIGATAAWGLALALAQDPSDGTMAEAVETLSATRPTAVNLRWALQRMQQRLAPLGGTARSGAAIELAQQICDEDVEINFRIGRNGLELIRQLWEARGDRQRPFQVLTHCNAGWLATVDWGTALAPVYQAHDAGIPVHVWVDETRPRNQGAALTAWELTSHGVPHDVVVDNAGGHLMQQGLVDLCITGTDRTARNGDVCNKIGTYLKALAARDNDVPFHVALPGPTIDWSLADGVNGTPIEERDPREVTEVTGLLASGETGSVRITPPGTTARNFAFDVTPARLVSGLITERGRCAASEAGLLSLYPEQEAAADG